MKRYIAIVFCALFFVVWGCALVQRVPVYKNDALNEVFWANENLAADLAKIPGVNTPASPMAAGVAALWADYHGGRFRDAFEKIIGVGIAEGRAYPGALEALLWLYVEDPESARAVLSDYGLDRLLAASWGECADTRWDEWGEVRSRLSAPELCVYYAKKALKYRAEPADGKNYLQSPYETLLMRGGDCEDFAALITEALEFNGWFARLFTVDIYRHEEKKLESHTVATYRDGGKWYFIQGYDAKYLAGGITGPFDQANDMADYVAGSVGGETYYFYIDTALEFMEAYKALNRGGP